MVPSKRVTSQLCSRWSMVHGFWPQWLQGGSCFIPYRCIVDAVALAASQLIQEIPLSTEEAGVLESLRVVALWHPQSDEHL